MIDHLNNNIYIQKEENIEGKKENILVFECKGCFDNPTEFYNARCLTCFFKGIFHNKSKRFEKIFIESFNILLDKNTTELILDYSKHISKIKKHYKKINELWADCKYSSFGCKHFSDFKLFFRITDKIFYIPTLIYQKINEDLKFLKGKKTIDSACVKCLNQIKKILEEIQNSLNYFSIIKEINKFQKNKGLFREDFTFWIYFFEKSDSIKSYEINRAQFQYFDDKDQDLKPLAHYKIYKNDLYQAEIYRILDKTENIYKWSISCENEVNQDSIEKTVQNLAEKIPILMFDDTVPIEDLIRAYKKQALRMLELKYTMSEDIKKKIGFYTALTKLHLDKIFALLLDDHIEEIFIDSPEEEIYINHQKYGRCRTNIKLNIFEIERLITLLRIYSEQRLDYSNPTLKYVIKNKYFFCRFGIDIEPINVNRFSLDIRKLNKNILTIQDLLKFRTLDPRMAALLYFCVFIGINITITGKTDTGKTTLMNSFDLIAPEYLRKIYIENVEESLRQKEYGKHQLKFQADSLEDALERKHTKSSYIKTLLHRTPDRIYLGEILTKEEAQAMFHCLAAGLIGFQTIHSNTVDSLIDRLINDFHINHSRLDDLDLVVLMRKDFNSRRIVSISEIDINQFQTADHVREIFEYNPKTESWDVCKDLFEVKPIKRLLKYEKLDKNEFENLINLYEEIFIFLLKAKKISNDTLVDLFNKISHYSITSYILLQDFWSRWLKKQNSSN